MDQNSLSMLLLATMSPNLDEIKRAEEQLKIAKRNRGFSLSLLSLCRNATPATPSGGPGTVLDVAKAAAICFKNFVKLNWNVIASQESGQTPDAEISPDEKREIKATMVDLMCAVHPSVQKQLSEGVRVIAAEDWPYQWEDLLPRLTTRLLDPSQPIGVTNGVLSTMNELFKRFRDAPATDELHMELKIGLDGCQEQLLRFFKSILCPAAFALNVDQGQREQLYFAVRLCCRIFYSLNWQTIPEFFEDHAAEWMEEFLKFLKMTQNPFPNYDDEENAGPLERVQSAIFDNVGLYEEKYAKEFQPFLMFFIEAAFHLLVAGSNSPHVRFDELVNAGMKFVSSAVVSTENSALFSQDQTMRAILEQIVIPNLAIRQYDVESFEDNPIEYLRRDIEGSDAETRRRMACDLIEKLCRNHDLQVTTLCSLYITQLLEKHVKSNGKDWAAKDAAITLVIAVSVRASTQREGCTQVKDQNLVLQFLRQHIIPEFTTPLQTTTSANILKADAIKYVATFRQFIPKDECIALVFPHLISHLDSKSVVVHTYAAAAIDGLLASKEPLPPGMTQPSILGGLAAPRRELRMKKQDIAPFVQPILIKLFSLIDLSGSNYNEYLMKCVVRVINVSREDVGPVVPDVLQKLSAVLGRVASNPSNPVFNHFMFESIAALLKFGFESQKCTVEQLENAVNPAFGFILEKYIIEFVPYVLQIMAQTLTMRKSNEGIPPHFQSIFPAILSPTIWEQRANIPALVMLLEAYLIQGASQMFQAPDKINQLFSIFQRLLEFKSTEDLSFELMRCVVGFCPFEQISQKLVGVLQMGLTKYAQFKSPTLASSLTLFLSVLVAKRGPMALFQCLEQIQPGMFQKVMTQIVIPTLPKFSGPAYAKKAIGIAFTRILTEFMQQIDEPTWNAICVAQVEFLSERGGGGSSGGNTTSTNDQRAAVNEALEHMAEAGHSTAFARLAFARDESANDFFPEVNDPIAFFMEKLLSQAGLGNRALNSFGDHKLASIFKLWAKGGV